jgi:ERCC4-type nuclease
MNQNVDNITIIADDRECKSEVIKSLSEKKDITVEVKRLLIGDYLADNRLVFERKTLNDFAKSIIDGRLFKQAIRLASSNYKSVLILEGTGKDLIETGMRREAIQGALIMVSLILGIPVLRSINPFETANLITYATRQMKSIAKGTFQRHGYQPKDKQKKQLFILQGLPGVGAERAARLLDRFGSIEAVITASSGDLQSVDGIGKNIAERIKWAVSEQTQPYEIRDTYPI